MFDRDFRNARASPCSVDGNEAMHLAVQTNVFQRLAAVSFQRTTVVMKWHAADPRDQTVRDHRRYLARDHLVFPVFAPTGDDVVTLIKFIEETCDVRWIVLEIGVHRDQYFSLCRVDARGHRCCLTVVPAEGNDANARIELSDLA